MRTATLSAIALATATIFFPSRTNADTFAYTRSEKLAEKDHSVAITLKRDHAVIEVVRTITNGGERADQALFHIQPGNDRVAVRLRTRSIVDGKPTWFEGDLMEAEAAAMRYRELTGIGGYYPKDPALLSWRHQGHLALQVFPCMPKEEKQVAYTLLAPMRYEAGHYVLDLDAMGTDELSARATLRAEEGTATADGVPIATELRLDHPLRIEQAASFQGPLSGALGSVTFARGRVLADLHVEVAPRLSVVPENARVVVLVDGSRSLDDETRAVNIASAASYLSHFTGAHARAAIFRFDRRVTAMTSGFVSIDAARAALVAMPRRGTNGSEIGLALEAARTLLASSPDGAERRIVLLTDLATRDALTPESVAGSLPKSGVLHIGVLDRGDPEITRDDEDLWAKLPRSTGGLLYRGRSSNDTGDEAARRNVFEEWARPRKLEHVRLVAPGFLGEDEALIDEDTLVEGQGFEQHAIASRFVASATLTAELWSSPVRRTWQPDSDYEKTRAALVFGSDLLGELSEPEMMTLAMFGRAVSPVTSYLAIEPGVRPSTEGLDEGEGGGGQGFGIGLGRLGSIGYGSGRYAAIDLAAELRALLEDGVRACGVAAGTAKIDVESTFTEIVDVTSEVAGDDAKKTKAACVREVAWAVSLGGAFAEETHRTTSVTL